MEILDPGTLCALALVLRSISKVVTELRILFSDDASKRVARVRKAERKQAK